MTCWLAQFSSEPCDGVEDLCHLIPKQLIKREVSKDPHVVWHPFTYVPGCRRHHAMLDVFPRLRIPRSAIPQQTERFAAAFKLGWYLDREYGETNVTSA